METNIKVVIMSLSIIIVMLMTLMFVTLREPEVYKTEAVLELIQSMFGDDYITKIKETAGNIPSRIQGENEQFVDNQNLGIFNVLKPVLRIIVATNVVIDTIKDLIVIIFQAVWQPIMIIWNWLMLALNEADEATIITMINN